MWIYQEAKLRPEASVPLPPASNEQAQQPAERVEIPSDQPVRAKDKPPRRKADHATRDCILIAVSYLFGTLLAGVLQAVCDADEAEALSYYLACWRGIFAVTDPAGLAGLFCAEFFTVALALTVVLLLGLSAVGPMLIFLFVMLYGTGAGLLFSQIFSGMTARTFAAFVIAAVAPAAVSAAALCVFGASALQVSARLHAFSFSQRGGSLRSAGARTLLGQYAVTAVAILPLCGAATGLAYLAGQVMTV